MTATTRAAVPATRVLAQARFEALGLLRHGEQLLVSLVLPLLAMLVLVSAPFPELATGRWAGTDRVDLVVPGVLALAVLSTAFTGQAILLGFERRWGVLRLLGTTPLGRDGLLVAKALSVLAVLTVQVAALGTVGALLGWRPAAAGLVPALVAVVLGAAAFALLAACLGGSLRAEAVLALANLVWVLLAVGGGALLPLSALPPAVAPLVAVLPSAALGEALRAGLVHGVWEWSALGVLAGWGAAAAVAARLLLRWSD